MAHEILNDVQRINIKIDALLEIPEELFTKKDERRLRCLTQIKIELLASIKKKGDPKNYA